MDIRNGKDKLHDQLNSTVYDHAEKQTGKQGELVKKLSQSVTQSNPRGGQLSSTLSDDAAGKTR